MKHAASVRPEPGSNSPLSEKLCPSLSCRQERCSTFCCPFFRFELTSFFVFYSVFKVQNRFSYENQNLFCYLYFQINDVLLLFILSREHLPRFSYYYFNFYCQQKLCLLFTFCYNIDKLIKVQIANIIFRLFSSVLPSFDGYR